MSCKDFLITDPKIGLIFMGLYALFQGAVSTYVSSMLTTIEKRFNFNSSQMGALMGGNDIGYLATVILVSYFGSKNNRQPLMLLLSSVGLWISTLLYVLPYVIFGPRYNLASLLQNNASDSESFCIDKWTNNSNLQHTTISGVKIDSTDVSPLEKGLTITIMMVAGIINGVSSTPFWSLGISFLDDMAGEKKSGIYMGILFGIRSFAPIIGFLFGSIMTTINEDLTLTLDKYLPGQKDSKWIGAWWLGWLILGFCILIFGPFMGLLRAKKKEESTNSNPTKIEMLENKNDENKIVYDDIAETSLSAIKDILRVFLVAIKNKIYVCLVAGIMFDILGNICLFIFFTKYLEYHFRASSKITNILTAICLSGSRLLSSLISGIISRTIPMNIRQMNRFVALTNTISGIMFPILLLFTCPTTLINGLNDNSRANLCSTKCNCQIKKLKPVCFNSTTYFSSCVIGCTRSVNETYFSGCGCDNTMLAKKGFCEQMCPSIYYFLIAFFIIKVINSMCTVQFMTMFLRLCDPRDKAVYLSSIGFLFGIFGLAFPPISGWVIDSACVFRNTDSYGGKSNCLIYDNDLLRYLIFGVSWIFQIPACILYIASWHFTPADYRYRRPSIIKPHIIPIPTVDANKLEEQ